ncbi:hypothetical protein Hesp01_08820 [Herbidospora sp. NBRC 101105]|nr:hypothetical protein Hesp01_08820 [Herbidospora sp. NBRC 101105]
MVPEVVPGPVTEAVTSMNVSGNHWCASAVTSARTLLGAMKCTDTPCRRRGNNHKNNRDTRAYGNHFDVLRLRIWP